MPRYPFQHSEGFEDPADLLQEVGPLIKINISITDSLKTYFLENNKPIPPSVSGYGVLDTGASTTCVNTSILKKLGGNPVGSRTVTTPGIKTDLDVYPAKITFPNTNIETKFEEALAMKDIDHKLYGKTIIAFLGRDVLSNCIFIYNGKTGDYSIEC